MLLNNVRRNFSSVVKNRLKYLSPSLKTFEAFDDPLVLERGEMQYLYDDKNNKYIDLLGNNLTVSVGHSHPKVVKAAVNQMKKLSHCTTMYYHEEPASLAKELVERLPTHPSGDEWVVHFVNSGSEAVDLAVQMARVYTGRPEMIGLHKGYHGLQGYAAGLTAIGKAEQPCYSSMFSSISHVSPNNIEQLEDHLKYSTGGKVAGFIAEPLQGYGGIYSLKQGYLKEAFKLINYHGGVSIADEVQTGMCRTGESFFGFETQNNKAIPDMITMAKGLGNGVGLIGAVICRRSIAEAFTTKMFFNTYACNPVACAASRAVLKVIDEENIMENCQNMGKLFHTELSKLCLEMPEVYREIRGQGLFQGLEVAGSTLEKSGENAYELHRRLLKQGILLGRGSAAGNVFRIQPPMCIGHNDVLKVVEAIRSVGMQWKDEKLPKKNIYAQMEDLLH